MNERTTEEQAQDLLNIVDEQLTRLALSLSLPLTETQRLIGTHMYLMGILTNPASIEEADAVYEAFKVRLGYTDDEIATDIIGG